MDIHIHRIGRKGQVQYTGGKFAHHDLIAVGFLQCGDQQLGLDRAVVDKKGLQRAAGPGIGGKRHEAGQAVALPAAVQGNHFGAVPAIDTVDGGLQGAVSRGGQDLLAVPDKLEGHLRVGKGLQLDGGSHPAPFHGVGFHKFHPGRGVEEQIPHQNGGAVRASGFGLLQNLPGLQCQTGAHQTAGGFGHQTDPADGGNGGQSFAPEAHGSDNAQILGGAQLGGGVAEKGGAGILIGHTAAVVRDPQEGHAAVPDLNGDLGGAGIHGVFQQLLDNGGWPLHHLTGGNQIGNMGG